MSKEHLTPEEITSQEEIPSFPFPFEDHSLQLPAEYASLRQQCPVAKVHMPYGGDAFLPTHHQDIAKVFTDSRCGMIQFSDGPVPRLEAGAVIGTAEEGESLFSVSDERHNKVRRLVTRAFTVQAAKQLRPRVVEVTNTLIDAMERSGPPADLFEDYAIKTPMTVVCEMLGVPQDEEELYRESARIIISTTATKEERFAQMLQLVQALAPIIQKVEANPGDDVLGLLAKARQQGDDVITEAELFSFAIGLIAAGFETVSTTFTNSAFIVLQRPDLLEQLKVHLADPERATLAIEELLRITPIGAGRPRITRDEVEIHGTHIPSGEVVFLSPLAANFDPEVFSDPDKIQFDRAINPMLSFGRGIHACLGQQIARMELRVLWATLLRRLPTIRLAVSPEEVPWRPDDTATFGPAHLPVTWG